MQSVVRFSSDLSAWIAQSLDAGSTPASLVKTMREQQMAPEIASAIVSAFVAARRDGRAAPVDAVVIDDARPDYLYEAPILRSGTTVPVAGRNVCIAARAERPMLAVLSNVLDREECEKLIALARPRLTPSTVVDPMTGKDVIAGHRTSLGMFFRLRENDFIARIDERAAEIMNMPVENGEGLQVLYYPEGAQSMPHFDFLAASNPANQASLARSGQRVSTMVMYLNDVEQGGETVFPDAGWAVSPQRGNAVYFEYCNSLAQVDHASLHASAPVLRGGKWVATKWMRQRKFVSA